MESHPKPEANQAIWIFGYGSLIWRPDFPFVDKKIGFIKDWCRRFYQGSTDHRGVPGAPGRVVTLLPCRGERCLGVAFRLPDSRAAAILRYLDHREKGGYARLRLPFFSGETPPEKTRFGVTVYVARTDNPHYLGPDSPSVMAEQILSAQGPSGKNLEYFTKLYRGLDAIGGLDDHMRLLLQRMRELRVRGPAEPSLDFCLGVRTNHATYKK